MLTDTCCPATRCLFGIHVDCISAKYLIFLYVTVDLYPFVSSNGWAANWQQFCCRYKKHVDGNMLPWCKRGFRDRPSTVSVLVLGPSVLILALKVSVTVSVLVLCVHVVVNYTYAKTSRNRQKRSLASPDFQPELDKWSFFAYVRQIIAKPF